MKNRAIGTPARKAGRFTFRLKLLSPPMFVLALMCLGMGTAPLLAQGMLAAAALGAKAKGESTVTVTVLGGDEDAAGTAEEFLRNQSVVLATMGSVQIAHSDDTIYTWHIGRLDRVLRTAPVLNAEACSSIPKPKPPFLKPTEVAIGVMGGTVTVSGVAVTVKAHQPVEFVKGSQVLVAGQNCGGSMVVLAHGNESAFDVRESGVLSHRGDIRYRFVSQLLELNTPAAIENYLRTIKY